MFVESAKRSTNSISNALGIIMSWAKEEGYSSRHGFLFFIFCGGKNRKKKKKMNFLVLLGYYWIVVSG